MHPKPVFSQIADSYASAPSVVFLGCAKRRIHSALAAFYRGQRQSEMKKLHMIYGMAACYLTTRENTPLIIAGLVMLSSHERVDRWLRTGPKTISPAQPPAPN